MIPDNKKYLKGNSDSLGIILLIILIVPNKIIRRC